MNLGVNLTDYSGANAVQDTALFDTASTSPEQLAELSKALEAGSISGNSVANASGVAGQGAALKVESLERNLKLITFREQDIRLWKRIPKSAAYNTVEEYNQLVSYGADRGGFNNEGELPQTEDSTYVRKSQLVKFLGVTKEVTHQMQLVNLNIGPIMQREITNGTMWILRKANRALAYGDASVIPQEFNGLYKQHQSNEAYGSLDAYHNSDVVIDLRGKSLTQGDIENASEAILENFGFGTLSFAAPGVWKEFAKDYYERQRIIMGGANANGITVGTPPKVVSTTTGDIELQHDIFLKASKARKTGDGATSTNAPNAPTADGTTPKAVATDTLTKFADGAGDYFYGVSAINKYGESAITPLGTSTLTIATTEAVDLKFTSGGGANPATGYVIYRSKKNPSGAIAANDLYPIFTISAAELATGYDGGATGLVRDRNRWLAGCEQAMVLQADEEVYAFKQLAPLMKMDLAVLSPATRFMILLYGTPQLYAPKKMVRIINIGPYVAS